MSELIRIANTNDADRLADVVFVHGLGGNNRDYWMADPAKPDTFWPSWVYDDLAAQDKTVAVWSLGYDAAKFAWSGDAMPLTDRAVNALQLLSVHDIGRRPIIFVTHSLGGLLVKRMLRHGLSFGVSAFEDIANRTHAVSFIATPHTGADLASYLRFLSAFTTVAIKDLEKHDPQLRELNTWFRTAAKERYACQVFCETRKTGIKQKVGVIVVDKGSADPGIQGVVPIPLDEDHQSICRPQDKQQLLYLSVLKFVRDQLAPETLKKKLARPRPGK